MEKHVVNIEESQMLLTKLEHLMQEKMCYNNVFHVLSFCNEKFREEGWKIAYGFVTATNGIMARHAFVVNEKGEAVDPTLAIDNKITKYGTREYMSFAILEADKYLDLLWEHDREPALYNAFRNEEADAHIWGYENRRIMVQ